MQTCPNHPGRLLGFCIDCDAPRSTPKPTYEELERTIARLEAEIKADKITMDYRADRIRELEAELASPTARRRGHETMSEELEFRVSISAEELAHRLADGLTRKEQIDLIKELDDIAIDWDFTLELAEHFAALKLEHALEVAADARNKSK